MDDTWVMNDVTPGATQVATRDPALEEKPAAPEVLGDGGPTNTDTTYTPGKAVRRDPPPTMLQPSGRIGRGKMLPLPAEFLEPRIEQRRGPPSRGGLGQYPSTP